MAEEKKLSVAEMLAAARKLDGADDANSNASKEGESATRSAASPSSTDEGPSAGTDQAPAALQNVKSGSIAEMLARAGGQSSNVPSNSPPDAESAEATSSTAVSSAKPGSIAEMLAKAGGQSPSVPSTSPPAAKSAEATNSTAVSSAKPGSIAAMLAQAGGQSLGGSDDTPKHSQPASPEAPSDSGSNAKPGSIAAMMAAARGEAKASPDAKAQPAKKSKPNSEKKSAAKKKAAAATAPTERMDTSSVLAGARGDAKRGPVSKAEAPERPQRKRPAPVASPKLDLPEMPQRPAHVKSSAKAGSSAKPGQKGKVEERRQFFLLSALFGSSFATGMTLLSTTAVVWTLALARYLFPNVLTEPPSQFKVGFPDDFAPGQVETKFKAQFGIWLVSADYQGEPCIFALSTVCTHLGCTPNWLDSEQKFKCPCHGSGFYKDGINFEGPAPRPLERYAIRVASDGQLEVDKSRKYQEEMGQWQDPASFVSV